jgi:hypothetical protein
MPALDHRDIIPVGSHAAVMRRLRDGESSSDPEPASSRDMPHKGRQRLESGYAPAWVVNSSKTGYHATDSHTEALRRLRDAGSSLACLLLFQPTQDIQEWWSMSHCIGLGL